MQFLYLLEKIRNPVFDWFFSLITHIGEEVFFLALAIIFFWCIDKRRGYYILTVGLVGTLVNQVLKLAFRIERPWVRDPDFTIVESARAEATGYSFPSGHTQNVAGTFGTIAISSKSRPVRIISVALIALVAFSRMYLGVHTPLDVVVSLAVAAALSFALYPIFKSEERFEKLMPFVVFGSCLLSIGFVLFVSMTQTGLHDAANLASATKNAYTLIGCTAGLVVVYTVDSEWLKFDTRATWYAQIIKLALGLGIVLLIKSGLSAPLVSLFKNEYIARAVRYFLIVIFAGILWPLTFRLFARLRIGFLDRFTSSLKDKHRTRAMARVEKKRILSLTPEERAEREASMPKVQKTAWIEKKKKRERRKRK